MINIPLIHNSKSGRNLTLTYIKKLNIKDIALIRVQYFQDVEDASFLLMQLLGVKHIINLIK